MRYYWPNPRIAAAVEVLRRNIDAAPVPPGLIQQFAGGVMEDAALPLSTRIVEAKVGAVAGKYIKACEPKRRART